MADIVHCVKWPGAREQKKEGGGGEWGEIENVPELKRKNWSSKPGCLTQFKNKWEFLQPFPVFRRISLHTIMDKSAEGRLKSIGNTTTVQGNPPDNRKQLKKFPLSLEFLFATGLWASLRTVPPHTHVFLQRL